MNCPACHAEVRTGARFCSECAAELPQTGPTPMAGSSAPARPGAPRAPDGGVSDPVEATPVRVAAGERHRRGAAAALAVGVTFALVVILGIAILAFGGGNDGDSATPVDSSDTTSDQVTDRTRDGEEADPGADDAVDEPDDLERSHEAADVTAATVVAAVTTAAPATEPPTTPAPTTPPTTAAPAPPATAPAPSPVQSSPPAGQSPAAPAPAAPVAGYIFPYNDFYAVPRLGAEHVRGTGCGGGGEIGEVIPDGIWHGLVANLDESATFLDLDLYCIYLGTAADDFIADFVADGRTYVGDRDWLPISNSPRTRRVPLDPSFVRRQADWIDGSCVDQGIDNPPERWYDVLTNWLVIDGGRAVVLLTGCPSG